MSDVVPGTPRPATGVRLLPNAVTVLALCSGLSGVEFILSGNIVGAVAAIGLAAVFDALDGRLARLLDATSRIGAELDSLSDCVSFGVSPALILFVWSLDDLRVGWVVALVFAVSTALRLARFNTLSDDTEAPPFANEFFVGVPSPAGALVALTPLALDSAAGPGWWSSPAAVAVWTVLSAALMISRLPTMSLKSVRVPPRLVAPLLVVVALAAAAVITVPFLLFVVIVAVYLLHIPFAVHRHRWLHRHPEVWDVPAQQRRAVRRASRRLGLAPPRRPLRRRVAGAAARAGGAARRNMGQARGAGRTGSAGDGDGVRADGGRENGARENGTGRHGPRRAARRLGLRRTRRRGR